MGVKRLDHIAIVAFEFDGVFTDNKVISDSDGVEYVVCSRADSYGISMLHKEISDRCLKTRTMVVTTEANSVVKKRCKKMGIMCHDNVSDKKSFMQSEIDKIRSSGIVGDIIFVGNDLNDKEAMLLSDLSFAPTDAHSEIKKISTHVFASSGGNGFVREVVEWLLFDQESRDD